MDSSELLEAHDRWVAEGQALREKLLSERNDLLQRLKELNQRLSAMGVAGDVGQEPMPRQASLPLPIVSMAESISPDDSMSAAVRKVLRGSGRDMSAAEIIEVIEKVRPIERRASIHSMLNQLKEKKKAVDATVGSDGVMRFRWKGGPV